MIEKTFILILSSLYYVTQISCTYVFAQGDVPVTAYYAGWSQGSLNNGVLPAEEIDYHAVSQIIQFSVAPLSDGRLDDVSNSVSTANSAKLISRAHAAKKN